MKTDPNKSVLDNRLPAAKLNDHCNYNPQPAVEGAPPVGGARPLTLCKMKILIVLLAITISSALAASKKWPDVPYTHVVGYCYDFSQDPRGASISFPDGSLHKGVIKATTVRLSDEQTKSLLKLLTEDVEYERGEEDCYDPHHAFVFYDSNWKIVASIDICFLCEDYAARPKGASKLIDLRAMEVFCRQIGLPWYEESKDYTNLYRQDQPTNDPHNKAQKKPNDTNNADPFEPAE